MHSKPVDGLNPIGEPTMELRTLTERAYAALRTDIITGDLSPEMKLQTESLKARYGLGGSTLREALTRLTGEALVTFEGQRGFRVAPVSVEDFADLCETRRIIEIDALRRSILAGDDRWESGVVAAYHRLSRIEDQLPLRLEELYDEWEKRNAEFHKALIAACRSRWLHRIHEVLFHQAERYRRITFASRRTLPRNIQQEHKGIMEATIARDVDAACGLAASHISKTVMILDHVLQERQQRPSTS